MVKRWNFDREFKLQILQQLGTKSVAEIGKENNIHQMVIYKWEKESSRADVHDCRKGMKHNHEAQTASITEQLKLF